MREASRALCPWLPFSIASHRLRICCQDAIEKELQERGLPTTIDAANSGSAKEQLIGRLEKARMDTSNLTHAELVAELRRLHLSTDGPEVRSLRFQV